MKDERLVALIELQAVITERTNLCKIHEAIPDRLQQLEKQIETATNLLQEAQNTVQTNNDLINHLKNEFTSTEEKYQQIQAKLNQVKTTKDYEARQKEIKVSRERITELEKLIKETEDKLPALLQEVENKQHSLKELEIKLSPEIEKLRKENAIFEEALNQIEERIQEKRSIVDSSILKRFDNLLRLRNEVAVVPIVEDSCGGCGIQVSPQTIQLAKRGLDLLQCDRCSSYLYWNDDEE